MELDFDINLTEIPIVALNRRSFFVGLFGIALTSDAIARDRDTRVTFRRGEASASFRGLLINQDVHTYWFEAKAGQKLSLTLDSPVGDVMFSAKNVQTGEFLSGEDNGNWSDTLAQAGKYEINVFLHEWHDNQKVQRNYKLSVAIL